MPKSKSKERAQAKPKPVLPSKPGPPKLSFPHSIAGTEQVDKVKEWLPKLEKQGLTLRQITAALYQILYQREGR